MANLLFAKHFSEKLVGSFIPAGNKERLVVLIGFSAH